MDRHRYVVAKRVVIKHVDSEKEDNVDEPSSYRNTVRPEEERRPRRVKLREIPSNGDEQELDES